ncbi:MAG: ribbon-helix-helix domain-containing protein, partial [Candidatus Bathyarchaeia archaeon]
MTYTRIQGDCLKLISMKIPETQVKGLDVLLRARMYQSRSAAIRVAVRDLLKKELWE